MNDSKFYQTELDYTCGIGLAKVNVYTGRLLYKRPLLSIGANNFSIAVSIVYSSHYHRNDFGGRKIGFGNGWKINYEQHVFPYDASYALDGFGFKNGDYVFIDSNWSIHRFVKYKENLVDGQTISVFYDAEGTGLRLHVCPGKHLEIFDDVNNLTRFDLDGRSIEYVSAMNREIVKSVKYSSGNIISIYDIREKDRSVFFSYNTKGSLERVWCLKAFIDYFFEYESSGELCKIVKMIGMKSKDYLLLRNSITGQLKYIIDGENLRALNIIYCDNTSTAKVLKIINSAMKENVICSDNDAEYYVGEEEYLSDTVFPSNCSSREIGSDLVMPAGHFKNYSTFSYNRGYTDISNEKGIIIRYNMNKTGETTNVVEKVGNDSRTLFKTLGWELLEAGTSEYSVNGKRGITLSTEFLFADNKPLKEFENTLYFNSNGTEGKHKYTENFIVSFWIRGRKGISKHSSIDVNLQYVKGPAHPTTSTISKKTFLEDTHEDCWQHVCIPVKIIDRQHTIWGMYIAFYNIENVRDLEIADLRIMVGVDSTIYIGETQAITLDEVKSIRYENKGSTSVELSFTQDFFMTGNDFFKTCKSMAENKLHEKPTFDLICCDGKLVIEAKKLLILANDNRQVELKLNESGVPNYYNRSISRLKEEMWNSIEIQTRFHTESADDCYYEVKTMSGTIYSESKRLGEGNSPKVYEWTNWNGTKRDYKDRHGVLTSYRYDSFWNLTDIIFSKEGLKNSETLKTEYIYDVEDESKRENPKIVRRNGIETEYKYNDPQMTPQYVGNVEQYTRYKYDIFHERVTETVNTGMYLNSDIDSRKFKYDSYGNLVSISDKSNRTLGYEYNSYCEPIRFYENQNLILEKSSYRSFDYDVLTDKLYNCYNPNTNEPEYLPYKTTVQVDRYGRIRDTTNYRNVTEKDKVEFIYQNLSESQKITNIDKLKDPYQGIEYNYIYDEENRPVGYITTRNNETGVRDTCIRQIGEGETQYSMAAEGIYIASSIEKDTVGVTLSGGLLRNPQIYKTKYVKMKDKNKENVEEIFKEFTRNYNYDHVGRLYTRNGEAIKHQGKNGNPEYTVYVNEKIGYKKNTCIPSSQNFEVSANREGLSVSAFMSNWYQFNAKGDIMNMMSSGDSFKENPIDDESLSKNRLTTRYYSYLYDIFGRLKSESRKDDNNLANEILYDYSQTSDHLRKVTVNGRITKAFKYEMGKKVSVEDENGAHCIHYDRAGNIVQDGKGIINYSSRNLLDSYTLTQNNGDSYVCSNYYNYQGTRYRKKVKGVNSGNETTNFTNYVMDGNKFLEEYTTDINNNIINSISYFYSADGIIGLRYDGHNFTFLKDMLGNVNKVMYQGKVIGEYLYDAWGNHEIVEIAIANDRDRYVLYNNPFRWKSYYYDIDTRLYLVMNRFYSPFLLEYLDARSIESSVPDDINGLNRHALQGRSGTAFIPSLDTISTTNELFPDPNYDPLLNKTWWEVNWLKVIQWVVFIVILVVTIALCLSGVGSVAAFGMQMLWAGIKGALTGTIIGGLIGGVVSKLSGNGFRAGLYEGAVTGGINGFSTGVIFFCIGEAISSINSASSAQCFVAGTLVLTSEGHKKIEDIEVGDEVWSYDEESQTSSYKEVLRLFRNETLVWHHIEVDGKEIVCTPEHPFYVLNASADTPIVNFEDRVERQYDAKWVAAKHLKVGNKYLLSSGKTAIISKTWIEPLNKPETTYNFEVAASHTYFVGEQSVLVHNACSVEEVKVIGRLDDNAAYKGMAGFDVLDDPNWTLARNDAWIQSGIDKGQKFLVVSKTTPANLISSNPMYPGPTVFARELNMLYKAGYVWKGNFLIPGL